MIILYSIGLFYITLIFYLAVMSLARHEKYNLFQKIIFYPIVVIGLVVDVLFQISVGTVLFLEEPKDWLFTARLIRHVKKDNWRGKLARFMCKNLLDLFDPSGSHCS